MNSTLKEKIIQENSGSSKGVQKGTFRYFFPSQPPHKHLIFQLHIILYHGDFCFVRYLYSSSQVLPNNVQYFSQIKHLNFSISPKK